MQALQTVLRQLSYFPGPSKSFEFKRSLKIRDTLRTSKIHSKSNYLRNILGMSLFSSEESSRPYHLTRWPGFMRVMVLELSQIANMFPILVNASEPILIGMTISTTRCCPWSFLRSHHDWDASLGRISRSSKTQKKNKEIQPEDTNPYDQTTWGYLMAHKCLHRSRCGQ